MTTTMARTATTTMTSSSRIKRSVIDLPPIIILLILLLVAFVGIPAAVEGFSQLPLRRHHHNRLSEGFKSMIHNRPRIRSRTTSKMTITEDDDVEKIILTNINEKFLQKNQSKKIHRNHNSLAATLLATVVIVSCCCTFGTFVPTASAIIEPSSSTGTEYSIISNILNHDYDDPLHPQCQRTIKVDRKDPSRFHYKGTRVDGPDDTGDKDNNVVVLRGCSPTEIREFGGIKRGSFDGKIIVDNNSNNGNGNVVKLDAGDGIHVGVWEPAGTAGLSSTSPELQKNSDVDGIRWNDGNKWIVKRNTIVKSVGEVIFLAYIGFSTLAGFKGVYDAIQRKQQERTN
jgi:hypothetical protein